MSGGFTSLAELGIGEEDAKSAISEETTATVAPRGGGGGVLVKGVSSRLRKSGPTLSSMAAITLGLSLLTNYYLTPGTTAKFIDPKYDFVTRAILTVIIVIIAHYAGENIGGDLFSLK